jgi:hypothetical protein
VIQTLTSLPGVGDVDRPTDIPLLYQLTPLNCQLQRRVSMPVLIRRYKGHNGMMQEERIDDEDRIERYMKLFEKDDVKKLGTGVKVFIEKDEWQLLP